jgi:hypothetical protein
MSLKKKVFIMEIKKKLLDIVRDKIRFKHKIKGQVMNCHFQISLIIFDSLD